MLESLEKDYLADRNILIDDPKDKTFAPFGEARRKIENAEASKSREMYFAIYQAIAKDEHRPGLYREYARDFFDLIIVDECHRGSAKDESNWREILDYFQPAYQLGMTATPLRNDNIDKFHAIRHYVASYLADKQKFSITQVSRLLRHQSKATTERYLQVVNPQIQEVMASLKEKSHPESHTKERPMRTIGHK